MNAKRIIAAALSSAAVTASSMGLAHISQTSFIIPITASAASDTAGSVMALSIPDSDILVESDYKAEADSAPVEFTSYGSFGFDPEAGVYTCLSGTEKSPMTYSVSTYALNRLTLGLTLTVSNDTVTDNAEKINELVTFYVSNKKDDFNSSFENEYDLEIEKDSQLSDEENAVYILKGTFISYYGNSDISLQFDSQLDEYDITLSDCTLSSASIGYIYSTVTDNTGQVLHLALGKKTETDAEFNDEKYNEWLRNLGRYISSLSDITEIKFEDIYISFDDSTTCKPSSQCDYINDDSGQAVGILIKFPVNSSPFHCGQIMDGNLDWGIMHEISHAYSFLNEQTQSYAYFNSYGDEGLVNVRGITAIQNCNELKSQKLVLNKAELGNYMHALKNSADIDDNYVNGLFDQLYIYDKYGSSFPEGWAVIEQIMLGECNEIENSTLKTAIEFVKESKGYTYGDDGDNSVKFSTRSSIRFINALYYLCKNHPGFGSEPRDFKRFLREYVSIERLIHYCNQFPDGTNSYALPSRLLDVDGDDDFDRDDLQAITDFVSGKRALSPEGVFQADYNNDGYIDEQDAAEIENMWF